MPAPTEGSDMRLVRMILAAPFLYLVAGCAAPSEAQSVNVFPSAQAPGERDDTPQELANKRVVFQYYDALYNRKDVAAASRFVASGVKLHNPALPDGVEGLRALIQALADDYPNAHNDVKRVLTDGDQVFIHAHAVRAPGTSGFIAGDIFRLE